MLPVPAASVRSSAGQAGRPVEDEQRVHVAAGEQALHRARVGAAGCLRLTVQLPWLTSRYSVVLANAAPVAMGAPLATDTSRIGALNRRLHDPDLGLARSPAG
jgi:hypothetical protein